MAIVIPILTEFSGKGIAKAKAEFAQLEGFGAKAGFVLKKSMIPATAAVAGLAAVGFQAGQALMGMAQAAAEDQKEQAQLAIQLRNFAKANKEVVAGVEEYIDRTQRATGVADSKLRPAFGRLVRSTKDVEQAQRLLNLAMNISAVTGKPLEAVSNALAKSYDGQDAALGRLGIGLDKAQLKAMSLEEQTAFMEKRFKGGAAAAADTFQGKMDRLTIATSELKESIGAALLPKITDLLEKVLKVSDAFGKDGFAGALVTLKAELPGLNSMLGTTYDLFANIINFSRDVAFGGRMVVQPVAGVLGSAFNVLDPNYNPDFFPTKNYTAIPDYATLQRRAAEELKRKTKPNLGTFMGPVAKRPSAIDAFMGPVANRSKVTSQQINVTVTSADPRAVVDALVKYNRQNGAIPVTVGR